MIRDPGCRQLGSGMEKSRIRDKQPGSVTLCPTDTDTDPNPQFWFCWHLAVWRIRDDPDVCPQG